MSLSNFPENTFDPFRERDYDYYKRHMDESMVQWRAERDRDRYTPLDCDERPSKVYHDNCRCCGVITPYGEKVCRDCKKEENNE